MNTVEAERLTAPAERTAPSSKAAIAGLREDAVTAVFSAMSLRAWGYFRNG